MPIPNINLIPPAYYLRKKVRTAWVVASALLLAEVAGLVAFAVMQSQRNTELKADRDYWKGQAQIVQTKTSEANTISASVADIKGKTDFIRDVFTSNDNWPTIFDQIRDYSYPRARYTAMTPAPGTSNITLNVQIPDMPQLDAQQAMTLYWSNLMRSPIVKTATVNTFLGYKAPGSQNTTGSGLPMPGGVGGPPMPGGGPPIPGGPPVPGGPPMPGAPTGGRWLGSPSQVAAPAVQALGGAEANLVQMLGGGGTGLTPEALEQYGIRVPQPPPTEPFTFSVVLTKTFTVPEYKATAGAAPADEFAAQDDFQPTPIQ